MSYLYEKFDYSMFESRFRDYGRLDQFSAEGLRELFDYLESIAECGEPVEIDVIGLCCEFSEESWASVKRDSGCDSIEDLQDETWCVLLNNGNVLYQNY